MWNATELIDTEPPITNIRGMGLWELGNEVIAGGWIVSSPSILLQSLCVVPAEVTMRLG